MDSWSPALRRLVLEGEARDAERKRILQGRHSIGEPLHHVAIGHGPNIPIPLSRKGIGVSIPIVNKEQAMQNAFSLGNTTVTVEQHAAATRRGPLKSPYPDAGRGNFGDGRTNRVKFIAGASHRGESDSDEADSYLDIAQDFINCEANGTCGHGSREDHTRVAKALLDRHAKGERPPTGGDPNPDPDQPNDPVAADRERRSAQVRFVG